MSSNATSYRQVIECFRNFCSGHYLLGADRFTHGQKDVADNDQDEKYPFMHVVPTAMNQGTRTLNWSFDVFFADKPNTELGDKSEYHAEALSDCARLAQDLLAAINPGVLFGDMVSVDPNATATPFIEEDKNVLTGWVVSINIEVPNALNACDIPGTFTFIDPSTSTGGRAGQLVGFGVIVVDGQSDVEADTSADTVEFEAGTGMTITTNAATKKVTFSSAAGGLPDGNYGAFTVTGGVAIINDEVIDSDQLAHNAVDNTKLTHMAQNTIKGNDLVSGDPKDLTANEASAILDTATDPFLRTSDANFDASGSAAAALSVANAYTDSQVPDNTDGLTQGATNLYNQTHTGEVTGSGALTLDKTAISNRSEIQIQPADIIIYGDTSDNDNLKKDDIESVLRLKNEESIIVNNLLGGVMKAFPVRSTPLEITTNLSLANQVARFIPIYLTRDTLLTGVKFYQITIGNYTGNNYNGCALYRSDGAGGMDLVAQTTNNADFWKTASATWATKPFASTYQAPKGMYWIEALYCQSGQTTAPIIGACPNTLATAVTTADHTNSYKLNASRSTQTTINSSVAHSALTAQINRPFIALY